MIIREGSVWQNNKNKHLYTVWKVGKHSETLEKLVFYENETKRAWARPYDLFLEKFTWMHD